MHFSYQSVLILVLLVLFQHPVCSTVTISSIKLADTDSSTTACTGSVKGGMKCVIMLNGVDPDPSLSSICFTRSTDTSENKCVAVAGKLHLRE